MYKQSSIKVSALDPIKFGRHKGKTHMSLLSSSLEKYAKWIVDQGESFRYSNTRDYIIENQNDCITQEEYEKLEIKSIKDLSNDEINQYLKYKAQN
jgi:hypothetical protein